MGSTIRGLALLGAILLQIGTAMGQPPPPPPPLPLMPPPAPEQNPVTEAKANLGKALFWDEQLSSTRTVSCGTCHISAQGGDDPRSILGDPLSTHPGADGVFDTEDDVTGSPGVPANLADGTYVLDDVFGIEVKVTGRRARSMIDAAFSTSLFWDGRAGETLVDPISGETLIADGAALETQALGPPLSDTEMAHIGRDWIDVAERVAESRPLVLAAWVPDDLAQWMGGRTYPELFDEAFGDDAVSPARIAMAIATYERTLFSDETPFDAELEGEDVLTAQERRGRQVFRDSRCNLCHAGGLLSDDRFHYIGLRPANEDAGRFAETGDPDDLGTMRTPSLRNVALRAPYMHTGQFATLEEVVDFYDRGGDFDAPNKRIRPIGLSDEEKAALVAFLERPLTDPRVAAEAAPFDRPILYTESDRVPEVYGEGIAGAGGFVPRVIALEPPLLGNPSFTVAIDNARGGAHAEFILDEREPPCGGRARRRRSQFSRTRIVLEGEGPGAGYGSVSLALPSDPSLNGETLFGRWCVRDRRGRRGFAASAPFRITLFGAPCPPGQVDRRGECAPPRPRDDREDGRRG